MFSQMRGKTIEDVVVKTVWSADDEQGSTMLEFLFTDGTTTALMATDDLSERYSVSVFEMAQDDIEYYTDPANSYSIEEVG